MGIPSQATDDVVAPTPTETTAMEVDEPEPVSAYIPPTAKSSRIPAKAYPGQTVLALASAQLPGAEHDL